MEIVYEIDVKMKNHGEDLKYILKMDISYLNILAFSSSYLSVKNENNFQDTSSLIARQANQAKFCVYICPLEQPWNINLITTSTSPIVQIVWSLDGTHLLVCNQKGFCQIFKMKNDGINHMEIMYEYDTYEDIICTKYIFQREPIELNFDSYASFYEKANTKPSQLLNYALVTGSFICVTTSGIIHALPIDRSILPSSYNLSEKKPLNTILCDIFPTEIGFNLVLSEDVEGALIHFYAVNYASLEPKISFLSSEAHGFRIPSSYGKLESLSYFQRNRNDCILVHLISTKNDLIELYEYNFQDEEWISVNLLHSFQERVTSISLSQSPLLIQDDAYQGLFGRQILIAFDNGSIGIYDKLNLTSRKRCFQMNEITADAHQSDYLIRMQHTYSGSCCVGLTQSGNILLLRTINLTSILSLPSMVYIFVHLFEQYIFQIYHPFDLWDVLCLIPNDAIINQIVEQLVSNFELQSIEFKRLYFIRFKECLYHLHRLACPLTQDSSEHLTTLLIYHVLLITRDYLRLFIYEPTNRNFVDAAQEILQQTSYIQNVDVKQVKYLGDQLIVNETNTIDPTHYQLISFTLLINWICDIIFYFIGFLQTQHISSWLICKNLFTDSNQLQWLREFMIYIHILNKMNRIPCSKIANLVLVSKQQKMQSNAQEDILKDIYDSLTKFSQQLEMQNVSMLDENFLEDWSTFSIEMVHSKTENMFPKSYPFLIPNSSVPQRFVRDRLPSFAYHLDESFMSMNTHSDNLFDVITLGKMSLSSNPTYRRCLRCSNFSRILTTKPYPLLFSRLNNRCLCGGLFYIHSQSNISEKTK